MKVDFKKTLKEFYNPSAKKVTFVDVPEMQFLMIDGEGNPNTGLDFQKSIEALYPLAYTIKFLTKKHNPSLDYVVPPLEGLWWANDMTAFTDRRMEEWLFTLMIMQPDYITKEIFQQALQKVQQKGAPEYLHKVRLAKYKEGLCGQILHLGPFTAEGPNIEKIHDEIKLSGGELRGKHHEIYLSDMRKVSPEKYRTVLRQPYIH